MNALKIGFSFSVNRFWYSVSPSTKHGCLILGSATQQHDIERNG
jgi:hypothetical protein